MNAYSEIGDGEAISQGAATRRLKSRARPPLVRRMSCLLLAALPAAGAGYFLATASLAAILAAIGLLLVLIGLLVAAGLYALDNVR
jgi:hypothetical protein